MTIFERPFKQLDPGHVYILSNGEKLTFQRGPAKRILFKGTTNEEILDVLADRLTFLQAVLPCVENLRALDALREAKLQLMARTKAREVQGVEGTSAAHSSTL